MTLNNCKHKTRNVPRVHMTSSLYIFTIQHAVRLYHVKHQNRLMSKAQLFTHL